MKFTFLLFACIFFFNKPSNCSAQTLDEEISTQSSQHHCISDDERMQIEQQIELNIQGLREKKTASNLLVLFNWPLRQKSGVSDPSYYFISNFVDNNRNFNVLSDYNCGSRTYDDHTGTDIAIWPFPWAKVANNEVEVIAAATGTIVFKQDGHFDQQCSQVFPGGSPPSNGIILRHADGSRSWYWHMKRNSLTSKSVGQVVNAGEYLGVVASSGNSTGPHLHFEVDLGPSQQLIDPWRGSCNRLGGQSWWTNQYAYRDPKILKIMTHNEPPKMNHNNNLCPSGEAVNASNQFQPGQRVYFAGYFRDYLVQTNATYRVKQPSGAIWKTWSTNYVNRDETIFDQYWTDYLPSNAQNGTWAFEVSYRGQTVTHRFSVGNASACTLPAFFGLSTSNITSSSATLNSGMSGYSSYEFNYRVTGTSTWNAVTGSNSSITVTGLSSNTNYEFRVRVRCSNGAWSTWTGNQSFTTSSNSTCLIPLSYTLSATNISNSSATLNSGMSGYSSYEFNRRIVGASTWTATTSNSSSVNVTGLSSGTTYEFRVRVRCSNGAWSQWTGNKSFTTISGANCTGGTQHPQAALTPTSSWKYQSSMWGGEYCLVNVQGGVTYIFSYCPNDGASISFDGELSLKTTNDQLITYSDDFCGAAPKIVWTANFTGQVRVLLTKYSCAKQNTNSTMAYRIGNPNLVNDEFSAASSQEDTSIVQSEVLPKSDLRMNLKEENRLKIFPNPTNSTLKLNFESLDDTPIRIYLHNSMGQRMIITDYRASTGSNEIDLDVSKIPQGTYLLNVKQNSMVFHERVVVIH